MAIRDIVTAGFGNGTYDPGVNKLPTRGYSTASATPPDKVTEGFILRDNRSHYTLDDNRSHYVLKDNRSHYGGS